MFFEDKVKTTSGEAFCNQRHVNRLLNNSRRILLNAGGALKDLHTAFRCNLFAHFPSLFCEA